ncbi:hypothetical protein CKA32_003254 [Geitlerinema sp. FC II]|nr:hypothetical protein CKA32_003254 [Geitlerinema sp. FC II]
MKVSCRECETRQCCFSFSGFRNSFKSYIDPRFVLSVRKRGLPASFFNRSI